MVKVIFFDVDGTLFSHTQNAIPTSTKKALEQLKEKEIKRVIATGRHMLEMSMMPDMDIPFDAYITLNGQLCLDDKENVIFANPIVGADKECIVQMFHEKSIPIMLIEKDAMYINFVNKHVEIAQDEISTEIPEIGEYTGGEIYQAVAYIEKGQEDNIEKHLQNCKITRWNNHAVDIISRTGGKMSGIKEYLKKNNIEQSETMAFGDGENDIDMLEFVQIGIAMGNASDNVKKYADFVTDSVDEDGIEKALKELRNEFEIVF